MRPIALCALAAALLTSLPPAARAGDLADEADLQFDLGSERFRNREYRGALEGETDPREKAELERALAKVAPLVAVLRVTSTPPGATVFIDRREGGAGVRRPGHAGLLGEPADNGAI